jgi:hypothetical protein
MQWRGADEVRSTRSLLRCLLIAAGFILAALSPVALRAAANNSPAPLAQIGKPDAAETARILEQFRQAGFSGYYEFELHALPRRGAEKVFSGRLWGGHNAQGAVIRVEVADSAGVKQRFLLQNGARAAAWRLGAGRAVSLDDTAMLQPLIPGVEITIFDLQMPYLYWPDVVAESITRVHNRPAFTFIFRPPADFATHHAELAMVRAYFDAQYSAPVQTEVANLHQVTKTIALLDLKRIGEQYIPKSFDVRNEVTRDKTRFQVTAVALNARIDAAAFTPEGLAGDIRPPADITVLDR